MKLAGVRGERRSKKVYTTKSNPQNTLPGDKVERRFRASGSKQLLVCDVMYVATWSGFACVSFVTDVFSPRIVGWNVASTLKADVLPMQALEMAAWQYGGDLGGAIHHSDHGSNYMAAVYTSRVEELGAIPSTGTVGDSYDNALAEAVNGLYKTELIRQRGPWKSGALGRLLRKSNSRCWSTCGGGTTSDSMVSLACAPRSRSRRHIMLNTGSSRH